MYRVPYAEIPATIMKKIERLLENNGETIDRIIEENRKYVEKICKNIMKYLKSSIDARKARKAIFGMDEYDTITLEKLVYLIYSCLKHGRRRGRKQKQIKNLTLHFLFINFFLTFLILFLNPLCYSCSPHTVYHTQIP